MEYKEFNFADISTLQLPKSVIEFRWNKLLSTGVVFRLKNKSQLLIRRMTNEDVAQVEKLEIATFPTPWTVESFLYRLEEKNFNLSLVGLIEDEIVAYTISYLVYDELHFSNLAVNNLFLRNQIGEILLWLSLHVGIEHSCHIINLEVRRRNLPAINLYKKYGFEVVGIRKNYYSKEREDALLMSKEINWETPYGMV